MPVWNPHDYQHKAVGRATGQDRFGLFADPGLGKTAMTLEAFRQMRDACEVSRLLVVAPLRPAYSVWPAEAAKWDQFSDLRVHVLHGKGKRLDVDADIYVINPEGLAWLVEQKWADAPEMVAVDELTKFKHHMAGRSKHLRKLFKQTPHHFPYRLGLTGTPAPNGLEDLFGQAMVLDDGKRLGTTLTEFRPAFGFVPVPDGRGFYKWIEGADTRRLMSAALRDLVLRLNAKDHLKLPQFVEVDVPVRLPSKARTLYDQLRREMVAECDEGTIAALGAGAVTSKLRQVASGTAYLADDGSVMRADEYGGAPTRKSALIHTAKAEALVDLIEESGRQPMLVVYETKPELALIREYVAKVIGRTPPYIGGGVSAAEGDQHVADWNAGRLPVLVIHPVSAAHGLNLQAGGNLICWFTPTWDFELYDQLNKRLHRQGQTADTVFVYRLLAERTYDQVVVRAGVRKERTQESFLRMLTEEHE